MIILIIITAIIVSGILGGQERRHALELAIEFEKLGLPMPPQKPKLTMTQAVLNISVGTVMAGLGVMFLIIRLLVLAKLGSAAYKGEHMSEDWLFVSAFIAGGVSLIIVGGMAVRRIIRYNKNVKLHGKI